MLITKDESFYNVYNRNRKNTKHCTTKKKLFTNNNVVIQKLIHSLVH